MRFDYLFVTTLTEGDSDFVTKGAETAQISYECKISAGLLGYLTNVNR